MSDLLRFDQKYGTLVCGMDEVGRGPLAGPVTAACVHIPPDALNKCTALLDIKDSKTLTADKREILAAQIKDYCVWSIGEASVQEIDQINILQATFTAMRRAAKTFLEQAAYLQDSLSLIDGNKVPQGLAFKRNECIIGGDGKSLSIAAASVLAKVTRDAHMKQLAEEFPHYGWHSNAGYGAKMHLEAIEKYGPTPHHRMSFAPLKYLNHSIKSA